MMERLIMISHSFFSSSHLSTGFTSFSGSVSACEIEELTYVGVDAGEEMSTSTIWLSMYAAIFIDETDEQGLERDCGRKCKRSLVSVERLFTS